jgi:class 3 adenylate cyclase/tetratricopeptide (TPR) repeat protein
MTCPRCQRDNRAGRRFCSECGAELLAACPACGFSNEPSESFCGGCGRPLPSHPRGAVLPGSYTPSHLAERILVSRDALEGERKQVTVLFADLTSSMELLAEKDPEEARRALDAVVERMIEAVHRYEGTVNQIMGDGIMALFGAPLSHEDHAVRACFAALRMQAAVRRYSETLRETGGAGVEIRVGLNAGEVIVRSIGNDLHMDYSAIGQTTHLAARMEQMAEPGTILLTSHVLALARDHVRVKGLGAVAVKGFSESMEVFELIEADGARSRFQTAAARELTPFVGRDDEVQQLHAALDRVRLGQGQVVAVLGEPGVGKSRLIWEFLRSVRDDGWSLVEASALPYERGAPYAPVVRLLKACFAIMPDDDPRTVESKIRMDLRPDEAPRLTAPILTLLGIPVDDATWAAVDTDQRRRHILEAITTLLVRRSQDAPMCVAVEDLQWVDAETQAVLDRLIERLPTAALLLLVTYRPEYQHGWANKTYYAQIRIDALSAPGAQDLLDALLGGHDELGSLKALLIGRTEGNPFFLEECIRNLVETGVLGGQRGALRLTRTPAELPVPDTVQSVLAARIDRLQPGHKRVLQAASALGKEVPLALLEPIVDVSAAELAETLTNLQSAELLYEVRLYPEAEYTFKHTLTLDVTYGSLVRERRRELDARIVATIERRYADRLTDHLDRLAHHAVRGQVWDKAVDYCREAAARAFTRSALVDALHHVDRALEALAHLPPDPARMQRELELLTQRGAALRAVRGYAAPEVESVYQTARELWRDVGDTPVRFRLEWQQMQFFLVRGDLETAAGLAVRLRESADRSSDRALSMDAHLASGMTHFHLGDFTRAHEQLERGLALYLPGSDGPHLFSHGQDPGVFILSYLAWTLWFLGHPDQARERVEHAVRIAEQKRHAFSHVSALTFAARVFQCRRDLDRVRTMAGELVSSARDRGFSYYEALGRIHEGWARVLGEGDEAGLVELLDGYAALERTGTVLGLRGALVQLAESARRLGRVDTAREAIGKAESAGDDRGTHCWDAEIARLRAELGAESASEAERDAMFTTALETARRQGAKSLELRVALSYARAARSIHQRTRARELVREVAGRFTEGHTTMELTEAHHVSNG